MEIVKHLGDWCHGCYKASYVKINYTTRGASVVICWDCASKILTYLFAKMIER